MVKTGSHIEPVKQAFPCDKAPSSPQQSDMLSHITPAAVSGQGSFGCAINPIISPEEHLGLQRVMHYNSAIAQTTASKMTIKLNLINSLDKVGFIDVFVCTNFRKAYLVNV